MLNSYIDSFFHFQPSRENYLLVIIRRNGCEGPFLPVRGCIVAHYIVLGLCKDEFSASDGRVTRIAIIAYQMRLGTDKGTFEQVGGVPCACRHVFDVDSDYFLNGVQGRDHNIGDQCVRPNLVLIVDLVQYRLERITLHSLYLYKDKKKKVDYVRPSIFFLFRKLKDISTSQKNGKHTAEKKISVL